MSTPNTPASDALLGIAVVEDNDTLRELLVSYLEHPERQVVGVDSGEGLNALLMDSTLDIVVLDLNLPYEDGLSISRRLRRSHPHLKIIMLTARVRPSERTQGYDAGADVYLTKPTNVTELEAVVRNLSQRRGVSAGVGFVLNRNSQVLTSPEHRQVVLSLAEALLLEQLALAPCEGLETDTLLEQMRSHGYEGVSRENLAVVVSRLRNKVTIELASQELIQTVRHFGYRLLQPVMMERRQRPR